MNFNILKLAPVGGKNVGKLKWLGHLAALVSVTMWGLSFVSTKVLLDKNGPAMGPVEIYIYRFTIAYLLILLVSHKHFKSYSWRDELLFMICGFCAGSIYFIAENTALEHTTTTNVSLLTSISPLFTAILMSFFYKTEKPSSGMYVGSAVAFIGVGFVIFNSASAVSVEVNPLGDMLSLGAAVSWAIYSLVLRRLSTNYDAWTITRKTFFYGVVTSIPFLALSPNLGNPVELLTNPDVLINLGFLAIGASVIAYALWSVATRDLGAVTANNYMYFQSIITMIAAFFIINEGITIIGIIGCALIIGGLWMGEKLSK